MHARASVCVFVKSINFSKRIALKNAASLHLHFIIETQIEFKLSSV